MHHRPAILFSVLIGTSVMATDPPPLDDRVNEEKVRDVGDPPPVTLRVKAPLPPEHMIAEDPASIPIDAARYDAARRAIDRGLAALGRLQADDGTYMAGMQTVPTDDPDRPSPVTTAVTAMILKAALQGGTPEDGPDIRAALACIERARRDDGSYDAGALANYATSAVASALACLPTTDSALEETLTWLQGTQWDESEGLKKNKDWYGGAGYGKHGRPDLSNTQVMLEALYDAGLSPDEPAFQRAQAFISRTQNHESNGAEWAGDDGGFVYTPVNGGESMASQYVGEGRYGELLPEGAPRSLRSYGSMTYAGFKSLLYAGLTIDDPRVRAAFEWIRNNWTFDENPGVGQQGLYYYYHAMARALRVAQQDVIVDADDQPHTWRAELIDAIVSRQGEDGTWRNEADRWMEGVPELATAYAVLALQEALK